MVRLMPELLTMLSGPLALEILLRRNVVTGATMAFRRSFLGFALPFMDGWLHDEWLAILAAAKGSLRGLDETLIFYRQHDGNQCGMRPNFMPQQIAQATTGEKRIRHLGHRLASQATPNSALRLAHLEQALIFQRARDSLSKRRIQRTLKISRLIMKGEYHRFADGWRSAIKDFLAA